MLDQHAEQLADAFTGNAARREWIESKCLMRFGGRPPGRVPERPHLEGEGGIPMLDQEA